MRDLLLLACLLLAAPVEAQVRPFVFTVATGLVGSASGGETNSWTAYYDAGYAERTTEPFGYDGVEQRIGLEGPVGAGFMVLGHIALGTGVNATQSAQQAEVLKDVLGPSSGVRLAIGVGARREWEGTSAALARLCLGWTGRRSLLFGNLRLERSFAKDRDPLDVITTLGWLHRVGRTLRVGFEAVGEDLEGFWEADEAEGGAKLYAGPAAHWTSPGERYWVSASGGPIFYATRSGRSSPAPRPLDATGNGFTVRLSVGYTF
jgi:hypothetical protein